MKLVIWEYSLTVIMKPDRILRKLTYRQHTGNDTLRNMIHKTEHSRTHAELEVKKKIMKYMTCILHGGHLQQSTTMVQQVIKRKGKVIL